MKPISKSEIRKKAKAEVKNLSLKEREEKSALIFKTIASLEPIMQAKTIALYASLPDEVISHQAIEHFAATKRVVLPRVAGEDMDFYDYNPEDLATGAFGISEPQGLIPCHPSEIDVIIIPGVAFSAQGSRCGRGKGYYDKYLSRHSFRALKIGVCYKEQLCDNIPTEPHDITMDIVVSR